MVLVQVLLPHVHEAPFAAEPSVVSQGPGVQVLVAATHKRPVNALHATLPQTQVTELAADPSVFTQAVMGAMAHWLSELSQYIPLKELHAAVPQEQSVPVLSEEPPTLAQGSPLEHVLVEEVQ